MPRTVLSVAAALMTMTLAGCAAPAAYTAPAAHSDEPVTVAVVDSALPHGLAYSCFTIDRPLETTGPDQRPAHAEGTISGLLDLSTNACPTWRDRVRVVLFELPGSATTATTDLAAAIEAAQRVSPDLLVIPLTAPDSSPGLEQAVARHLAAGAVVVAAAGNRPGAEAGFPARLDGVIAIGARDSDGQPARFSAGGSVDVFLAGENVEFIGAAGTPHTWTGTSAATAFAGHRVLMALLDGRSAADARGQLTQTSNSTPTERKR